MNFQITGGVFLLNTLSSNIACFLTKYMFADFRTSVYACGRFSMFFRFTQGLFSTTRCLHCVCFYIILKLFTLLDNCLPIVILDVQGLFSTIRCLHGVLLTNIQNWLRFWIIQFDLICYPLFDLISDTSGHPHWIHFIWIDLLNLI